MDATIAKLIQANELDIYLGQVGKDDLENVIAKTGCALPDDYITFLTSVGFAFWTGHAINGIYEENDERFPKSYNFSVITQTMRTRQKYSDCHYFNYNNSMVIGKDDMGGFFLLISADIPTSHRVLWINYDDEWIITDRWVTFADFLNSQLP